MKAQVTIGGREITITTEHSASSYGLPVVLIDGELTNLPATFEHEPGQTTALDLLADRAGIHFGFRTRDALRKAVRERYGEEPTGTQIDQAIEDFKAARAAAEEE
jgi:hypothetical protein